VAAGEKPPPGIGENVAPDSSGDSAEPGDMNTAPARRASARAL